MKKWLGVLFVLATIIVPGIVARSLAQMGSTNAITIASVQPSSGLVTASGTYTVASGYTVSSITVEVMPAGGAAGAGGEGTAILEGSNGFYSSISVPSGTYDVQAILTVTDSTGTAQSFFSDTMTSVVVP